MSNATMQRAQYTVYVVQCRDPEDGRIMGAFEDCAEAERFIAWMRDSYEVAYQSDNVLPYYVVRVGTTEIAQGETSRAAEENAISVVDNLEVVDVRVLRRQMVNEGSDDDDA